MRNSLYGSFTTPLYTQLFSISKYGSLAASNRNLNSSCVLASLGKGVISKDTIVRYKEAMVTHTRRYGVLGDEEG
jgi:hypothetical protein